MNDNDIDFDRQLDEIFGFDKKDEIKPKPKSAVKLEPLTSTKQQDQKTLVLAGSDNSASSSSSSTSTSNNGTLQQEIRRLSKKKRSHTPPSPKPTKTVAISYFGGSSNPTAVVESSSTQSDPLNDYERELLLWKESILGISGLKTKITDSERFPSTDITEKTRITDEKSFNACFRYYLPGEISGAIDQCLTILRNNNPDQYISPYKIIIQNTKTNASFNEWVSVKMAYNANKAPQPGVSKQYLKETTDLNRAWDAVQVLI